MMKQHHSSRTALKGVGLLVAVLMFASCGVTDPDEAVWDDVGSFSWPTSVGTTMKYRTISEEAEEEKGAADTSVHEITVDVGDPSLYPGYYALYDTAVTFTSIVHYRPTHDTLFVEQDKFTCNIALTSPIEVGNRWTTETSGTPSWIGEIVGKYAYRKVEGQVYENVVAVRYKPAEPPTSGVKDVEWVRFYAKGVGEILTIKNTYPTSTHSSPVPEETERRVLIFSSAGGSGSE